MDFKNRRAVLQILSGAAIFCAAHRVRPESAHPAKIRPDASSVLIVVDVQNCFITGALAVPHGEDVVPVINKIAPAFENVVLTQGLASEGTCVFCVDLFRQKDRGIQRVFVTGLATDFCVAWTALDARKAAFETYVIEDACRGIDLEGSVAAAWREMGQRGIKRIQSGDIELG